MAPFDTNKILVNGFSRLDLRNGKCDLICVVAVISLFGEKGLCHSDTCRCDFALAQRSEHDSYIVKILVLHHQSRLQLTAKNI